MEVLFVVVVFAVVVGIMIFRQKSRKEPQDT